MNEKILPNGFVDLLDEAKNLREQGRWTKEEFLRIWEEAKRRKNHHGFPSFFLECIIKEAEPEWLS